MSGHGKTGRPMPSKNILIETYRRTGSARKAAQELKISSSRVYNALKACGAMRGKGYGPRPQDSKCVSCSRATVTSCGFIAAGLKTAGRWLDAMGATYTTKEQDIGGRPSPVYHVTDCPYHDEGQIKVWGAM